MATMEYRIRVKAPVDVVFAHVANLPRHPEWGHGAGHGQSLESVTCDSEGPLAVGSTFVSCQSSFGKPASARLTVTEFDPPRSIAFNVLEDSGRFREFSHRFTVEPVAEECILKRTVRLHPDPPALVTWLMRQLLAGPVNMAFLRRLAAAAESASETAVAAQASRPPSPGRSMYSG